MVFAKGKSPNPFGRPRKDGPKWANMANWFAVIERDLEQLTPLQRVDLAKWALEYLVENAKALPAKKSTQDQASDLLKNLEATSRVGSSTSTVESDLGQGPAKRASRPIYEQTSGGVGGPGTPEVDPRPTRERTPGI